MNHQRRRIRRRPVGPSRLPILCLALVVAFLSVFLLKVMGNSPDFLNQALSSVLPTGQKGPLEALAASLLPPEAVSVLKVFREPETDPDYFSSEEGFEEDAFVLPPEGMDQTPQLPQEAPEGSHPIEELTISPSPKSGYDNLGNIYVNNETDYTLDLQELLERKLPSVGTDQPQVLIVHTHTTESYTAEGLNYYLDDTSFRSNDETQNMLAVGDILTEKLEAEGIGVIHCRTVNDYPKYSGAYTRMLKIIEDYLAQYPTISCVLDIHRDAMITSEGVQYKVKTMINNQPAAQVMIVAGSAQGGLSNPDWDQNLSFAVKLQNKLAWRYPTLMRPIRLTVNRYNMHTTPRSLILEVGTSGNTLAEAKYSIGLVAQSLAEVLKSE